MLEGRPAGVTVHVIDNKIDHGDILYQEQVIYRPSDTSQEVYEYIQLCEEGILLGHFDELSEQIVCFSPEAGGSFNTRKDFAERCEIDLSEYGTWEEHINTLRALTHGEYNNAYFVAPDGQKVYLNLQLTPEE